MVGHGRIGNDHGHVDLEVRSLHLLSELWESGSA